MSALNEVLARLGIPTPLPAMASGAEWKMGTGPQLVKQSPLDGEVLAQFPLATAAEVPRLTAAATAAFERFRVIPAPRRGELVRRYVNLLRQHHDDLAQLVTLEAGKIPAEARGEVQEMIDVGDYAVGLSRQLYGLTIASERPGHRLAEQWLPLGPVAVITAFNFPVAVWAWNALIAWVCGDPVIWKPSEKTPLCALACHALAVQALQDMPDIPAEVATLIIGSADVGQALAASPAVPLVSATGSVPMGRAVAQTVAARLGRSLLELGGNNGAIIAPSADLELAVRAITFSAVGTCGQRCTTLRRLIVHRTLAAPLRERLQKIYANLPIGNPLTPGVLVGPLLDEAAFNNMQTALAKAREQGGKVTGGERLTTGVPRGGYYVRPALVEIAATAPIVQQETFAPILYTWTYDTLDEAIAMHNAVPQGLSSTIFTTDLREAELFCSAAGSDCGIVNVNIGTSGAEIGGAFGGEKETGGGRESGSDSWKAYLRRVTNTINYSSSLPLAQGIRFEVE